MRLSNLVSTVPAQLVACLDAIGIRTEMDLLFSASPFEIFRQLPAGTISLQELEEYIDSVAKLCAAPGLSGYDLLLEELAGVQKFELISGNEELDHFLSGLGGGRVIEISGDYGTGKSTLALNLVLRNLASHPENTALWIDTTGDFPIENATKLSDSLVNSSSTLERLQISLSFDVSMAQEVIGHLIQNTNPRLRLLVIDSVTPILGPLLSAVSTQGHAIMTDFMRQLQSISQNSGVTVIVINNTARTGLQNSERKPALGRFFALMTDTTLWLTKDVASRAHSISILKSGSI
ncbi:P-loop containing nucleoside triphosphate hydrolase protein [Crassisporium funariophilum]|nr:P-loop containing nucleoside triphosphate hydrolase protein [Crassisporium funariophilum]